jgi:hypothetical protein
MKYKIFALAALLAGSTSLMADWTAPVTLSATGSCSPAVGIDADNNGVATWDTCASSQIDWAPFDLCAGGWRLPATELAAAATCTSGLCTNSDVAVDFRGNAVAVWEGEDADGNLVILSASRPFGGEWQNFLQASGTGAVEPKVAVDPRTGTAYAAWVAIDHTTGISRVQAAVLPYLSHNWTDVTFVSGATASLIPGPFPHVSANGEGQAVAIWGFDGGIGAPIQASVFSGSAWGPALTVFAPGATGLTLFSQPEAAIDDAGNAVAVVVDSNIVSLSPPVFSVNTIASMLPTGASAWSGATSLATGMIPSTLNQADVTTDARGHAVAVWSADFGDASNGVYSSTAQLPTNVWSTPIAVSTLSTDIDTIPLVRLDHHGDAVAAWIDTTAGTTVVATLPSGDTAWTPQVTLGPVAPGPDDAYQMDLAVSPCGDALVVWYGGTAAGIDASAGTLLFDHCGPCPPVFFAGQTICNEFLTQTDVIHRLTWTASTDPTTIGYILERNGRFLAFFDQHSGTFEYDDHNRKNHVDHYTLFAMDHFRNRSTALQVTLEGGCKPADE